MFLKYFFFSLMFLADLQQQTVTFGMVKIEKEDISYLHNGTLLSNSHVKVVKFL